MLGSVAMTLCLVAAGQLDGMLSLRPIRSVDAAARQLLVTEAGGAVAFPADDELSLEMRSAPCWPRGVRDVLSCSSGHGLRLTAVV